MYNAPSDQYGTAQSMGGGNTSGQGAASIVPPEIQGLNWGAFLLNWIWGLGNGVMIALLALFIPFFNFYLLFKGNELAWRNKQWASVEAFQATQAKWTRWGVILLIATFVITCISFLLIFVLAAANSN